MEEIKGENAHPLVLLRQIIHGGWRNVFSKPQLNTFTVHRKREESKLDSLNILYVSRWRFLKRFLKSIFIHVVSSGENMI